MQLISLFKLLQYLGQIYQVSLVLKIISIKNSCLSIKCSLSVNVEQVKSFSYYSHSIKNFLFVTNVSFRSAILTERDCILKAWLFLCCVADGPVID